MGVYIGGQKVTLAAKSGYTGIPRDVSTTHVYQKPKTDFTFTLPSDARDVADYGLYNAFNDCTALKEVNLRSLTTVSGEYSLSSAFSKTGISTLDLSGLVSVTGNWSLYKTFQSCTSLQSVNLSKLESITGERCMTYCFQECSKLTNVSFNSLSDINAYLALGEAFEYCSKLVTVSFPSLNSNSFGVHTTQFNDMLRSCSNVTVHFPSSIQSVIGSWSSVTAGFGGRGTTILFDLDG